jgi:hypothetical protein
MQGGHALDLEHQVVWIAAEPVFIRLERLDDGVPNGAVMLGRVPTRAVVAAADMATGHADSQMDPILAQLQALQATLTGGNHVNDLIEVGTDRCQRIEPAIRSA